jgi:hypothetical protein
MSSLHELQGFFAKAALGTKTVEESVDPLLVKACATGNARLSSAAQLEIYREQFWMRHVSALVEDFGTVHHLLGHDAFNAMCEEYLATYPNADFSLRDLGAKLTRFLAEREPYKSDALLLDCARAEWAFVDAFDAADAPPLEVSVLATLPEEAWSNMRLTLHPSVQRVAMSYPAHELRALVKTGEDAPRPSPCETHLVVFRGKDGLEYLTIDPLAFALLGKLAEGATLGAACDELATDEAVTAVLEDRIGGWFQSWAAYGWISAIRVD